MGDFKGITVKVRKNVPIEWSDEEKKNPTKFETKWEDYGFNLYQLSYWRGFTGQDEQGRPGVFTAMYLNGNHKPIILGCKREDFEKAIAEQTAGDKEMTAKFQKMLADMFTDWVNVKEAEAKRARKAQHEKDLANAQEEE